MKKLFLLIAFLALLVPSSVSALTQQQSIDSYLSGRTLDLIEGIWASTGGRILVIYKQGDIYVCRALTSGQMKSGTKFCSLEKGSSNFYYGELIEGGAYPLTMISDQHKIFYTYTHKSKSYSYEYMRLWPEDIYAHNSKFKLYSNEKNTQASSGTAFFINQKGYLITNYHVVEGCNDKSKIIYQNKEIEAKLVAKDKYLDLALLKVEIKNQYFIKISDQRPKKLQRIIAAGYPFGKELSDDLKYTSGIISALKGFDDNSSQLQIDAALNYGNSGGPIVDENTGELVAVSVSVLNKEISEGVNFGIKASSVKSFIESNQINTSLKIQNLSYDRDNLAEILENATLYIFCK